MPLEPVRVERGTDSPSAAVTASRDVARAVVSVTASGATKEAGGISSSMLRWLLAALTLAIYWQVASHDFINYDDGVFVYSNPHVYSGLGLRNVIWAMTTLNGGASSYHPLTWLSHQLDCQLFGLKPGAQHLTNLWLHVANTLLLFTLLDKMTGRRRRSALVAALFALHPTHVETVAWISERKSLLCFFFWMLTTMAYVRYTRRGGLANYTLVVTLYAAALLSKPIAVSLPITLLLLDYWPLGRVGSFGSLDTAAAWGAERRPASGHPLPKAECGSQGVRLRTAQLLLEKVPLFLLSGLACWITVVAQSRLGAIKSLADVPMSLRLGNSLAAVVLYLRKTLWPADLAVIYPLHPGLSPLLVCGNAVLLLSLSAFAVFQARQRPYFLVGWVWYLVTLFPTLGLVQVGSQAMADRYSYVPLIGIFLVLSFWELPESFSARPIARFLRAAAVGFVAACAVCTFFTARYWQDSLRLFEHAVRVTADNYIAHCQLGLALVGAGNLSRAQSEFRRSLAIKPEQFVTEDCLGETLWREGDARGALAHYSRALIAKPGDARVHGDLAEVFCYSRDPSICNPRRALAEARLACALSRYQQRDLVAQLAKICAENQEFGEAHSAARKVAELCVTPQEARAAALLRADVRDLERSTDTSPGRTLAR